MSKRTVDCLVPGALLTMWLAVAGCGGPGYDAPSAGPGRLVAFSGVFGRLERPPARFDHDKHTQALEAEGCGACHGTDDRGEFIFTYSAVEGRTGRTDLANAYHDGCVGCHTRRARDGEKAGPVTCGECHELPAQTAEAPWPKVTFDYLWHDKHDKALDGKCAECHSISPQRLKELKAQGKEPAGQDWVWDVEENRLTERAAAHARCINCHLQRKAAGADAAGPTACGECHSGAVRSVQELARVPRPKVEVKDKMLLRLERGARAKAVAFDHQAHVAASRSCQECHHKTLRACGDCHTVDGSEQGGGITLAEAHHMVSSSLSCVGCHEAEKQKSDCAGCHQFLPRGLAQTGCSRCHTGSLDRLQTVGKLPPPEDLLPKDTHPKLVIGKIERQYVPADMPHLAIARKLTEISNKSRLARYAHTEPTTVCAGCHHLGPLEVKGQPPSCATCHTARGEAAGDGLAGGTPDLLGAYHRQCIECHKQMDPAGGAMPQTCTGCHEEKAPGGPQTAPQRKE